MLFMNGYHIGVHGVDEIFIKETSNKESDLVLLSSSYEDGL